MTWQRAGQLLSFVFYFLLMLGIGLVFMLRDRKKTSDSTYFLGGRKMGPYVTALSAQASDMSGWLLMGLPGSIMALGFGEIWVAIGLAIGTYLNWLIVAARLRKFSQAAGDSITIPQYLNNRFKAKGKSLQVIAAIIFCVCFTVYVASAYKAGAALFSTVLGLDNEIIAMAIFGIILLSYTFMGGFNAVCWTDFFQALLMLGAVIFVPFFVLASRKLDLSVIPFITGNAQYFKLFPKDTFWENANLVLSGLAWGLGYCGMPHILVRFMSIKSSKLIKPSRRVASIWVVITLTMSVFIGVVGASWSGLFNMLTEAGKTEHVFIKMIQITMPGFFGGIFGGVLLSAIMAAAMSTADSQLLVASSAFTSDIYKPIIRKKASDKETMWVGRIVVAIIAIVAFIIAVIPGSGSIMNLVSNAWAGFGAAFGPVIVLSLFWKRFTYKGAVKGMIAGGLTVVVWIALKSKVPAAINPEGVNLIHWLLDGSKSEPVANFISSIYEMIPGFAMGLFACIVGTLTDKRHPEAEEMYEYAVNFNEEAAMESANVEPVAEAVAETEVVEEPTVVEEVAIEEAAEETVAPAEESVE